MNLFYVETKWKGNRLTIRHGISATVVFLDTDITDFETFRARFNF